MDQQPQDPTPQMGEILPPGASLPEQPQYTVDKYALQAKIDNLKLEQNLPLGIIGGGVAGLLSAAAWAAVTYFTEYQIGWLAIGVGFLVGLGVRTLGKGFDRIYGVVGALIALVSVVLGNFLANLGFLAKYFEVSYLDMLLNFDYTMSFELMKETFSVMDILFYALAVYTGFRYSLRRIAPEKLLEGTLVKTG